MRSLRPRSPILIVVAAIALVHFSMVGAEAQSPPETTTTSTDPVASTSTTLDTTTTTLGVTSSTTSSTTQPTGTSVPGLDSTSVPPDGETTTTTTTTTVLTEIPDFSEHPGLDELPPDQVDLILRFLRVRQDAKEIAERIDALNRGIGDVSTELTGAQANLTTAEQKLDVTQAKLIRTESELRLWEKRLKAHAVAAYIGGDTKTDATFAILRADSADTAGKSYVYADAVIADERGIIKRTTDLRNEAAALQRQADADRQAAQRARDDIAGRGVDLERRRDDLVNAEILLLQNQEAQATVLSEAAIRRIAVDQSLLGQAQLSDSIAGTLATRQVGQLPPPLVEGIFLSPVANPKINSPFGARADPLFGTIRAHAGIDINGVTGTPIRAPADGVVVTAGVIGGYGNCTIIDHGNAMGTLYGHQSAITVKDGDVVRRGQIIGFVGSTGYSTGPHLHWEVRVLGMPVNPVSYIGETR